MTRFNNVKIIMVGDFMWPWYQDVAADNLSLLGFTVIKFGWINDFWNFNKNSIEPKFKSIFHKFQYRFQFGPIIYFIRKRLLKIVNEENPNIIFCYNVTLFSEKYIKQIKNKYPNVILCQYANDNPFSNNAKFFYWKNFQNSIKYFDLHYVFRNSDIEKFRNRGANKIKLLRAYFIPEREFPIDYSLIPDKFKCDVVFAGHYENDGRVKYLEEICRAGYKLNIFGGGWDLALKFLEKESPLRKMYPINPVIGIEYQYAICGAKVALCFLSTLNNDTYTTRSFQIPAMKTAMLSQFTEDLANMYKSDDEIMFFNNSDELKNKLNLLISDQSVRLKIANNGYNSVYKNGHDIKNRMSELVNDINLHYPQFKK